MKTDSVSYLLDAIRRAEGGGAASSTGSHLAGMFGKAANGFEKEVRSYVHRVLDQCRLDYETGLRAAIKGPSFARLTLGNLIFLLKTAWDRKPACVSAQVPSKWTVTALADRLQRINEAWVQVKHGDEVQPAVLIAQMKSMLAMLRVIRG
jgi:hypothetical protein